jgi:hypothetical protein
MSDLEMAVSLLLDGEALDSAYNIPSARIPVSLDSAMRSA